MKVAEVISDREAKEFIRFPKKLYKDDPFWVCPLDNEVNASFNPSKNHTFAHGEAKRWLLIDENGVTIGRIAAFIDTIRSSASRQPTGGIGFFEVINDKVAAFLLFDTAREWLSSKGMEAMDGPINFGENDTNWGLLVEGFTQPGFGMPYHKKYYKGFFEDYGFKNYFEQYSYHKDVGSVEIFPERFMKIADWISKKPGYSFRHFEFKKKDAFIKDLVEVYNSTWSVFKEDFTPLETAILMESFNKAKAFIDEELIWFAYHNGKPISFFILYPDLNQIIKYFNGKLTLWNMLRFSYFRMKHKMTRMRAVIAGVNPAYQNSGIESAVFLQLYKVFRKKTYYKELELSWVGDFNPKMMAIYEALGAQRAKTHITYRYYINDKLKYIRYKDEMAETLKERGESTKSH
jgi:GNAT superfamily N-acetyltransferase